MAHGRGRTEGPEVAAIEAEEALLTPEESNLITQPLTQLLIQLSI
jgi:hypothetical protein